MARVTYSDATKFENHSQFDIFNLENDGDSAKVQFLFKDANGILAYTVHEVPMKTQRGTEYMRKVGCLCDSPDAPKGTCPFCDEGRPVKVARYIPLYDVDNDKALLWERGPRLIDGTLLPFLKRTVQRGIDPEKQVVEIIRQGRKGDQSTTYAIERFDTEPAKDTSHIEIPDAEGTLIAKWSASDMATYINTGMPPQIQSSSSAAGNNADNYQRRPAPAADATNNAYAAPQAAQPAQAAPPVSAPPVDGNYVPPTNPADFF